MRSCAAAIIWPAEPLSVCTNRAAPAFGGKGCCDSVIQRNAVCCCRYFTCSVACAGVAAEYGPRCCRTAKHKTWQRRPSFSSQSLRQLWTRRLAEVAVTPTRVVGEASWQPALTLRGASCPSHHLPFLQLLHHHSAQVAGVRRVDRATGRRRQHPRCQQTRSWPQLLRRSRRRNSDHSDRHPLSC